MPPRKCVPSLGGSIGPLELCWLFRTASLAGPPRADYCPQCRAPPLRTETKSTFTTSCSGQGSSRSFHLQHARPVLVPLATARLAQVQECWGTRSEKTFSSTRSPSNPRHDTRAGRCLEGLRPKNFRRRTRLDFLTASRAISTGSRKARMNRRFDITHPRLPGHNIDHTASPHLRSAMRRPAMALRERLSADNPRFPAHHDRRFMDNGASAQAVPFRGRLITRKRAPLKIDAGHYLFRQGMRRVPHDRAMRQDRPNLQCRPRPRSAWLAHYISQPDRSGGWRSDRQGASTAKNQMTMPKNLRVGDRDPSTALRAS